jgi:hypothetical protein
VGHGPVLALLLLTLVHVAGIVLLIALLGREVLDVFRTKPRGDDDGGPPPDDEPLVPQPRDPSGLPLPDAAQAPARLREPGRLAEHYPRPARRPEHEPGRVPEREPDRG